MPDTPSGINYNAFSPHTTAYPSPMDYFSMGQQAVQSVLDDQFKAQTRQRLLDEQDQRLAMERLLGPARVAEANWEAAGHQRPTYNSSPISGGPGDTSPFSATLPGLDGSGIVSPTAVGSPSASSSSSPSTPSSTAVSNVTPNDDGTFSATGTVFGGPKDLAAYNRAKASGATELQALAVGDNGVGAWGANTADPTKKYVAVSPDFMAANNLKPGDPITVNANGKSSFAYVGDKLPNHSANGAGIDLNPGVAADLGVDPNTYKGQVTFKIGHYTGSQSNVALPGVTPVSQDGGFLDRAIAQTQAANPSTANLFSGGGIAPSFLTSTLSLPGGITSGGLLSSNVAPISAGLSDAPASTDTPTSPLFNFNKLAPIGSISGIISSAPLVAPSIGGAVSGVDLNNLAPVGSSSGIMASSSPAAPSGLTDSALLASNVTPLPTGLPPTLIGLGAGMGIMPRASVLTAAKPVATPAAATLPRSMPIGSSTGIDQPYKLATGFVDPRTHRFIQVSDPRQVPQGLTFESRAVPAMTTVPVPDEAGHIIGNLVNGKFERASTVDPRADAKVMGDLAKAGGDPGDFVDTNGHFDRIAALARLGQISQNNGAGSGAVGKNDTPEALRRQIATKGGDTTGLYVRLPG